MKKLLTILMIAILAISLVFPVCAEESDENVLYERILKVQKVDEAPDMENIDESTWGEPLIYVVESMPDAKLVTYWTGLIDPSCNDPTVLPESCEFYFYCCWDAKNLYLGVKSPDTEPSGAVQDWRGDGVQMWIKHRNGVENPYEHYDQGMYALYWTLAFDDYSVSTGDLAKLLECYITFDDEYMHATAIIPFSEIGIRKSDVADGLPLALVLMRISSRGVEDQGYAGWMNWGFDYVITLVLDDPEVEDKPLETIATPYSPPVYETKETEVDPAESDPAEIEPEETDPPVTDPPVTEPPATDPPETDPPVTDPPATEPPATEPPATEPPATEPPATEPPATEPPATEPPATDPPETDPPATDPPATEPPATEPPATEPPATEPPATDPPATDPPATDPPATEPPATEPPATEPPVTTTPAEKSNTGLIIGIIAAVVVVAVVVVVLLKKKK